MMVCLPVSSSSGSQLTAGWQLITRWLKWLGPSQSVPPVPTLQTRSQAADEENTSLGPSTLNPSIHSQQITREGLSLSSSVLNTRQAVCLYSRTLSLSLSPNTLLAPLILDRHASVTLSLFQRSAHFLWIFGKTLWHTKINCLFARSGQSSLYLFSGHTVLFLMVFWNSQYNFLKSLFPKVVDHYSLCARLVWHVYYKVTRLFLTLKF